MLPEATKHRPTAICHPPDKAAHCCVTAQVAIELDADAVPMLPGVKQLVQLGIRSSAHAGNARAVHRTADNERVQQLPSFAVLVDPQTSGARPYISQCVTPHQPADPNA